MSIETEGAINRLTAAVLALGVTVESKNGKSVDAAERDVKQRYETMLDDVVLD